jgi:hypothetical protein
MPRIRDILRPRRDRPSPDPATTLRTFADHIERIGRRERIDPVPRGPKIRKSEP